MCYGEQLWFQWKEEIDSKVVLPNGKPIPVVLLGNKCDLDIGETDLGQLEVFTKQHKFVATFDTSAKLNIKIDKACRFLVDKILEQTDLFESPVIAAVPVLSFFSSRVSKINKT